MKNCIPFSLIVLLLLASNAFAEGDLESLQAEYADLSVKLIAKIEVVENSNIDLDHPSDEHLKLANEIRRLWLEKTMVGLRAIDAGLLNHDKDHKFVSSFFGSDWSMQESTQTAFVHFCPRVVSRNEKFGDSKGLLPRPGIQVGWKLEIRFVDSHPSGWELAPIGTD